MFCSNCGKELEATVKYCPDCGVAVGYTKPNKSRAAVVVLLLCGGMLGLHKFYEGKKREGLIYLFGGLVSIFMLFQLVLSFEYVIDDPFLVIISVLPALCMGAGLLIDLIKTLET